MSLGEIVADVSAKHQVGGVVDRDAAVNEALPLVLADEHIVEQIVRQRLRQSIKQHLTKAEDAAIKTFGVGQGSLFDLRPAHVLAGEDGVIKATRALTRTEFQGLIKVRERQIDDDALYLQRLRVAADETALIWDRHPDWVWGQVEDAWAKMRRAA